jgi:hypothetical protein
MKAKAERAERYHEFEARRLRAEEEVRRRREEKARLYHAYEASREATAGKADDDGGLEASAAAAPVVDAPLASQTGGETAQPHATADASNPLGRPTPDVGSPAPPPAVGGPPPAAPASPAAHRPSSCLPSSAAGCSSSGPQLPVGEGEDLPPSLRPGGAFDKALQSGKQLPDATSAPVLSGYLEWQLRDIRIAYAQGRFADGKERTPAERFARALFPDILDWHRADPVLPFCLAVCEGFQECAGRWKADALTKYAAEPEVYEAIFRELIPLEFKEKLKSLQARWAYTTGSNPTAAEDWPVFLERLLAQRRRPLPGLSTGLQGLDDALGGLQGLTLLSGVAGVGKTSLALALALGALRQHPGIAVLLYSLEMSRTTILKRILCNYAGVDYRALVAAERSKADAERLEQAAEQLVKGVLPRLRIVGPEALPRPEGLTLKLLLDHRSDLLSQTKAGQALIVVDQFQHLDVPPDVLDDVKADRCRMSLLAAAQAQTRTTAHPEGDPFLVIARLCKDAGPTGLELADLLGSGDLGYIAGTVMFLEPAKVNSDPAAAAVPVVVRIAKGRDGVTRTTVPLLFDHTRSRFREPGKTNAKGKAGKAPASPLGLNPLAGGQEA